MPQTLPGVRRLALALLTVSLAASTTGCDLTVSDPNSTTNEDAYGTRDGLIASVVGLQRQYNTSAVGALVLTTGITSRELAADNTFANLLDLDGGGSGLATNNANVTGLFREMYQTIATSKAIINGAQTTPRLDPALVSGLTATAEFYQAAALGALATTFTQVATTFDDQGRAVYVSREQAFEAANALLASAEQRLGATPPNAAAMGALPSGFNLLNSIRAYRARFELFQGDLADALAAAGRVDPSVTSVFVYTTDVTNPIFNGISPTLGQPSFAVRDNLGLATVAAGDGRIDYFTEANADVSVNNYPIETATGFIAAGLASPHPVYIPDEMNLIRAEVFARQNNTAAAVAAINLVRQDTQDPFGLAANLGPYTGPTDQQSLFNEIYYNRATELYLQGLRLEDARRLNQGDPQPSNPFQRSRNFYPYPLQERLSRPGTTPADPTI